MMPLASVIWYLSCGGRGLVVFTACKTAREIVDLLLLPSLEQCVEIGFFLRRELKRRCARAEASPAASPLAGLAEAPDSWP